MKKLVIEKIEGYNYFLRNNEDKYEINIEFHDLVTNPKEGDCLYINEKLLTEKVLCFGAIDSTYGRKIESSEDADLLILSIGDERLYLKRLYG